MAKHNTSLKIDIPYVVGIGFDAQPIIIHHSLYGQKVQVGFSEKRDLYK